MGVARCSDAGPLMLLLHIEVSLYLSFFLSSSFSETEKKKKKKKQKETQTVEQPHTAVHSVKLGKFCKLVILKNDTDMRMIWKLLRSKT